MALDPRISLAAKVPDVGATFNTALSNVSKLNTIRENIATAPARQELIEAQAGVAQQQQITETQLNALSSTALGGLKLLPSIDAAKLTGNLEPLRQQLLARKKELIASNAPNTNETDQALALLDQPGGLQQLELEIGGLVDAAQRFGVFGETTTLQQNLQAAGLQPGTPEFKEAVIANLTRAATSINIGDKAKSAEQTALAGNRVTQLGKFREEREVAIDTNQSLDVLENIDVTTGALEPAKQGLAAFGKAFGIDTSGLANVAQGEAFNAEAKRIVLAVKASQKGPQTDKDEQTIQETVVSLGNSKEGNQFILDSARALNNRRIERADFFDNFLEENETLRGANRSWSQFKRNTPMVSSVMRTPQGLPVFFYKFDQAVRSANPDATREEILQAWRQANTKGAN